MSLSPAKSETAGAAPRKVIIVDDDRDTRELLQFTLEGQGYEVKLAANGLRLISTLHVDKPDLILLDVMMPGMDGYEVCRRLKADLRTREIPVIFLTARSDVEDERHGLELGAVDYITKPFSPVIVLARVKTHLALKAATDYLRTKNFFLTHEVLRRNEEIERLHSGISVQEIDLNLLTEVVKQLNGLLDSRDSESLACFVNHEDLLRAAFPTHIEEIRNAMCTHNYSLALGLLENAGAPWGIEIP